MANFWLSGRLFLHTVSICTTIYHTWLIKIKRTVPGILKSKRSLKRRRYQPVSNVLGLWVSSGYIQNRIKARCHAWLLHALVASEANWNHDTYLTWMCAEGRCQSLLKYLKHKYWWAKIILSIRYLLYTKRCFNKTFQIKLISNQLNILSLKVIHAVIVKMCEVLVTWFQILWLKLILREAKTRS